MKVDPLPPSETTLATLHCNIDVPITLCRGRIMTVNTGQGAVRRLHFAPPACDQLDFSAHTLSASAMAARVSCLFVNGTFGVYELDARNELKQVGLLCSLNRGHVCWPQCQGMQLGACMEPSGRQRRYLLRNQACYLNSMYPGGRTPVKWLPAEDRVPCAGTFLNQTVSAVNAARNCLWARLCHVVSQAGGSDKRQLHSHLCGPPMLQ